MQRNVDAGLVQLDFADEQIKKKKKKNTSKDGGVWRISGIVLLLFSSWDVCA